MLERRHLRTLSVLRECQSLSQAADKLCLTQSALSHQLADVEDYWGLKLFERKSRPLRFTPAGLRLLALADAALPLFQDAERELKRLAGGEAGRLHMAIECHSCFSWLMPAIDRYRDSWPGVDIDLLSGFSFDALPALAAGELDLVVTSDPRALAGLGYQPVFGYESRLLLAREHPLAAKAWIEPADLAGETLLTYPVEKSRLDVYTRFLEPAGVQPKTQRRVDLTQMLVQLVAGGRGVAALPNWVIAEYLGKADVVAKPLGREGLRCTLYAAIREEQRDAPYMAAFLEQAKSQCFESLAGIIEVSGEPGLRPSA
ncbi:MAG: LysR family transcriptional regulator [Gammaproteobacteria bacterium]|nr:LysR family transcriptional regulator [Gammaproteobacteria bacterium]